MYTHVYTPHFPIKVHASLQCTDSRISQLEAAGCLQQKTKTRTTPIQREGIGGNPQVGSMLFHQQGVMGAEAPPRQGSTEPGWGCGDGAVPVLSLSARENRGEHYSLFHPNPLTYPLCPSDAPPFRPCSLFFNRFRDSGEHLSQPGRQERWSLGVGE